MLGSNDVLYVFTNSSIKVPVKDVSRRRLTWAATFSTLCMKMKIDARTHRSRHRSQCATWNWSARRWRRQETKTNQSTSAPSPPLVTTPTSPKNKWPTIWPGTNWSKPTATSMYYWSNWKRIVEMDTDQIQEIQTTKTNPLQMHLSFLGIRMVFSQDCRWIWLATLRWSAEICTGRMDVTSVLLDIPRWPRIGSLLFDLIWSSASFL